MLMADTTTATDISYRDGRRHATDPDATVLPTLAREKAAWHGLRGDHATAAFWQGYADELAGEAAPEPEPDDYDLPGDERDRPATTQDPQGNTVRLVDAVDPTTADFQYRWNGHRYWLTADGEFVAVADSRPDPPAASPKVEVESEMTQSGPRYHLYVSRPDGGRTFVATYASDSAVNLIAEGLQDALDAWTRLPLS